MLGFETMLMGELWEMRFDNGIDCGFKDFGKRGKEGYGAIRCVFVRVLVWLEDRDDFGSFPGNGNDI